MSRKKPKATMRRKPKADAAAVEAFVKHGASTTEEAPSPQLTLVRGEVASPPHKPVHRGLNVRDAEGDAIDDDVGYMKRADGREVSKTTLYFDLSVMEALKEFCREERVFQGTLVNAVVADALDNAERRRVRLERTATRRYKRERVVDVDQLVGPDAPPLDVNGVAVPRDRHDYRGTINRSKGLSAVTTVHFDLEVGKRLRRHVREIGRDMSDWVDELVESYLILKGAL